MTTPEQETLADSLERCRGLIASATRDHVDYAPLFPLDETYGAPEPSGLSRHLMRSFAKSFEQFQDQVARQLLRAMLSVASPTVVAGSRKLDAILVASASATGLEVADLREFAAVRNSLAHDYAMAFHDVAPILNRAWELLPALIGVVATIEAYVATNDLLKD